jgi:hypothetical protein
MVWGRGEWIPQILSNLLGFAALIAVAYVVSWYKSEPWRKPPGKATLQPEFTRQPSKPSAAGGGSHTAKDADKLLN